jgi:chloramphenicol-sensitive protein RarD
MDGRRYHLNAKTQQTPGKLDRGAVMAALGAYFIWGFMPLFFKQLAGVPAGEIISHRVIWAVPLLLVIMALRGQLNEYRAALMTWATLRWMLLSSILMSSNWLIYVWAVNSGQILSASLGYYFNPLMNILVGTLFLGERLNRTQWAAVGIAALAAAVLAAGALGTLWISFTLGFSFCIYGLVRKMAPIGSVPGLAVETSLLLPVAIVAAYYFAHDNVMLGRGGDTRIILLLVAGGALTATPLLLFATAARRMNYSMMGFFQYIGPTIQFLLGVFLYKEHLSPARIVAFALIWSALALFSWDAVRRARAITLL